MNTEWNREGGVDYLTSSPDNGPGEADVFKEGKTTFPHQFNRLSDSLKREVIKSTPFGNERLARFVTTLLKNEKPGGGEFTDFLAISFSATDYVGHAYGPNSMEIMDVYLKLDKQISGILDTLDQTIGKGNYLLFLTADHGVKPSSAYLEAIRIHAGAGIKTGIREQLADYCKYKFGNRRVIESMDDHQIYMNYQLMDSLRLDADKVTGKLIRYMRTNFSYIGLIRTKEELIKETPTRTMNTFILNGFNINRSGDILFELTQNYLASGYDETGTTHESSYDYDTHVPLLFFGWHIKPGESNEQVYVEDIAPTITNLIHVQEPDASIGMPIIR